MFEAARDPGLVLEPRDRATLGSLAVEDLLEHNLPPERLVPGAIDNAAAATRELLDQSEALRRDAERLVAPLGLVPHLRHEFRVFGESGPITLDARAGGLPPVLVELDAEEFPQQHFAVIAGEPAEIVLDSRVTTRSTLRFKLVAEEVDLQGRI